MKLTPEHVTLIREIVRSAHYCKHSVAAEVAATVASAQEAYNAAATRSVRTESQARMVANVLERNRARLEVLAALKQQFASFRGESGQLPVFRDKEAKCEPGLAEVARQLQDAVELRAAESLEFENAK